MCDTKAVTFGTIVFCKIFNYCSFTRLKYKSFCVLVADFTSCLVLFVAVNVHIVIECLYLLNLVQLSCQTQQPKGYSHKPLTCIFD